MYAPGAPDLAVGDLVAFTGTVDEYDGGTQLAGAVDVHRFGREADPDGALPFRSSDHDPVLADFLPGIR